MAINFKGAHFPPEVILMGIRWYVAYPLRTRHVEALRDARGGQRPLPPHPVAPPGEPAAGRGVAAASAPGVGQGAEGRALQPGPGARAPSIQRASPWPCAAPRSGPRRPPSGA